MSRHGPSLPDAGTVDSARPVPHGTHNGYLNFGCRCDECRAAINEYMRGYRARRRANAAKYEFFCADCGGHRVYSRLVGGLLGKLGTDGGDG